MGGRKIVEVNEKGRRSFKVYEAFLSTTGMFKKVNADLRSGNTTRKVSDESSDA